MKQRLAYLDSIKGLGAILVILYHCRYVPLGSMYICGIYAICVPLFFMVNGYVMLRKEHSIRSLMSKNLKIAVILLFWLVLSTAIYIWIHPEWFLGNPRESMRVLAKNPWLIFDQYCSHLWFLKALFVLNVFNPIIYYFIHYKRKGIYYLLLLFAVCTLKFIGPLTGRFINPFQSGWQWYSVLYYLLGYALLDGQLKTGSVKTPWIALGVILLTFCQYGYNWCLMVGPLASHHWIDNIVWENYAAPFVVLLTASVCLLFQRINWKETGFLQHIGYYSLPIYILQTPVKHLLYVLYRNLYGKVLPLDVWTQSGHFSRIIMPVLVLAISYCLSRLLLSNRYTAYLFKI